MQFSIRIIKILLLGVFLCGSILFGGNNILNGFSEPINTINVSRQTLPNEFTLCTDFKKLEKVDVFLQLNTPQETKQFYIDYCKHADTFAWSDSSLRLNNQAIDLIQSIEDSYNEGLNPNKYHLNSFIAHIKLMDSDANQSSKTDSLNRIDVLLSDAYITLAKDLYYGITDWKQFKASKIEKKKKLAKNQEIVKNDKEDIIEWERAKKTPIYPAKYLAINLAENKISDSLHRLSPDAQEYRRLMESLKYYRTLYANGGWETIPSGATIRMEQTDERIPLIKKRLYLSGELHELENNETCLYSEPQLIDAVKSFQTFHNLTQDGLIGAKTINALNIPVTSKISKIILNLERFRWLNQGMDAYQSYININIPSFQMQVFEYGKEVIAMKVIVGKKERPTPVLNSKISYAVLKPSWTAPKTIVKEDILEKANMQEYLQSHNMRVYLNLDGEMSEVNADEIDWSVYAEDEHIPYIFKADSGEANPLGEVKFIFNNRFSVYMHDTNQRYLFKNQYRALSSGCLRLNEPMKLLTYLLDT
ncbi:MAG: L,D-transpeptidase family protein, partial [Sulfurimonas sp.]|nr:L,D-transpeptidase family protein [Sulfurimonas sp.]MBU4058013.1 L,D-transpeptidase family protein [bacterium]